VTVIHQLLVPTSVSEPLAVGSITGLCVFFAAHYRVIKGKGKGDP